MLHRFYLHVICLLLGPLALSAVARAGVEQISAAEFKQLAEELAPKVNLFSKAWADNPAAEFYGGTTRDYLYWIKGQFREARTREEAEQVLTRLRALTSIDVRDFIIGDSDVDIVSQRNVSLKAENFGVRKIDSISPAAFDTTTSLGQNEINQGYVPAEKIRLQKKGIQNFLGDGVGEIYRGKFSVVFAPQEQFMKTLYASQKENHPILLALRYLRLVGMNYFQEHGQGVPNRTALMASMDEASKAQVRRVIDQALDGRELLPYLGQKRFVSWLNGAVDKSFKSYTNPTAAHLLMKDFGVTELSKKYNGIAPMNLYLFAEARDEKAIAEWLKNNQVDPQKLYANSEAFFPDGYLYHGTRSNQAFLDIVFQGTKPSLNGAAGEGLYGVGLENKRFSEKWGGAKDRLVRLPVKPGAKIVDIRGGEGAKAFAKFGGKDFDGFARAVGADMLLYEYQVPAFVVKNGLALGDAEGVYRQPLSYARLVPLAQKAKTVEDRIGVAAGLITSQVTTSEKEMLVQLAKITEEDWNEGFRRKFIPPESFLDLSRSLNLSPDLVDQAFLAIVKEKQQRVFSKDFLRQVLALPAEKVSPAVRREAYRKWFRKWPEEVADAFAQNTFVDRRADFVHAVLDKWDPRLDNFELMRDQFPEALTHPNHGKLVEAAEKISGKKPGGEGAPQKKFAMALGRNQPWKSYPESFDWFFRAGRHDGSQYSPLVVKLLSLDLSSIPEEKQSALAKAAFELGSENILKGLRYGGPADELRKGNVLKALFAGDTSTVHLSAFLLDKLYYKYAVQQPAFLPALAKQVRRAPMYKAEHVFRELYNLFSGGEAGKYSPEVGEVLKAALQRALPAGQGLTGKGEWFEGRVFSSSHPFVEQLCRDLPWGRDKECEQRFLREFRAAEAPLPAKACDVNFAVLGK